MDKTVPPGAALLLDFIGGIEAPKGYDTIYDNKQDRLPKPVTTMTIAEVQAAQPGWSKSFGSSATGRYQFMLATLRDLIPEVGLSKSQLFDADLQDRLGYVLLKRRGILAYLAGEISKTEFAKRLAQEWASLPVLAPTKGGSRQVVRGQSFYAGDGQNKSLVKPEAVEAILDAVKAAKAIPVAKPALPPVAAQTIPAPAAAPAISAPRSDGAFTAPPSERAWWSSVFSRLFSKEP